MPWMSWSPKGDRLAYFVRTEKERTLIIQNVLTRKIEAAHPDEDRSTSPSRRPSRPTAQTIAFAGLRNAVGDIFSVDLATQEGHQPHRRRLRRLRADLFARRQVHRLQRARQRQPEAVPPRSRHEEEDAAHVRHHRRNRGAVHRRPHAGVLVDGDRSRRAARAGSRQERQHLQHLDARPEERRAAAVHRRARRQLVAGRAQRRQDRAASRSSATTRANTASARSSGRSRCTRRPPPTSARPARSSTSRRRCSTRWWPTTSGRRRRSRRCSSRAGRRSTSASRATATSSAARRSPSATCSATSSSTSTPRRSRSTARSRCPTSTCRGGSSSRLQGFSQTQFFYGQVGGAFYDPAYAPFLSRSDAQATQHAWRRLGIRHLPAQTVSPRSSYRRPDPPITGSSTTRPCSSTPSQYQQSTPAASSSFQQRHADAARRRVRPGDDDLPRVRAAGRQHDAARLRRLRRTSAACCRGRPSTRDVAPLHAARLDRPARHALPRVQEQRRLPRLPVLRRQLAICAATTTCSSPVRTSSSPTPSCASRLIEAALTPIGVIGGVRGVFFAGVGGALVQRSDISEPLQRNN